MKSSTLISIAALGMLIISCSTTLQRYSAIEKRIENDSLVEISTFPAIISDETPPSTFKTVFDLNEKGQAAIFVNKTNEQIIELLNKKFQESQQVRPQLVDLSKKNLRLTFSINKNTKFDHDDLTAFDRIEDLKYRFEMLDSINSDVKFTKWNKYTTEYGTLDIGTLEFNQSFTANLDVTGEVGTNVSSKTVEKQDDNNSTEASSTFGPKISATGKVGYAKSQKENQNIKQRYIQLTGKFGKRDFSIHQQGNREIDLAGNVHVDISISLPKTDIIISSFSNLYDSKSKRNNMNDVNLYQTRYYIPDTQLLKNGVRGCITYDFAVRNVINKVNTFPEFDDRIRYVTGRKRIDDVKLIDIEDLETTTYFISLGSNPLQANNIDTINFLDYEKALEFKTWLLQTIKSLKERDTVEISGYTMTFENMSTTEMKVHSKDIKINVFKY